MLTQRLALQAHSVGLQPELVLVLETVGTIDSFIRAVAMIEGLGWLGETDISDIAPEYGFEDQRGAAYPLSGQLYLVMSDQRALEELRRLFIFWQHSPEARFPRGLAPLRQAFAHLHTIRPWDAEDRIRDTGLLEDWTDRALSGQSVVPFEVELWYRDNPERRGDSERGLVDIIESLGGEVVQQCVIPAIAYHGVLGTVPTERATDLLSEVPRLTNFALLTCESVMYVRPVGQCAIDVSEQASDVLAPDGSDEQDLPTGSPFVALLDGLPLAMHKRLGHRLIIDDPDGYEDAYLAADRRHGTAMASLICHGDLSDRPGPITRPLYVRPILKPYPTLGDRSEEKIPENVLPVDLVHRAVRRLYESEDGEPPAAPSIRAINLSVCDRCRPLDRGVSPLARLLDWLSWHYNVLFIVSAGNHHKDIDLDLPRDDYGQLDTATREQRLIAAIAADTRHRRLLSPAESINALTVGAAHSDESSYHPNQHLIDPYKCSALPSVFSAHGPGHHRSIKPDLLLPGGRQLLREKLGNPHDNAILQLVNGNREPGQLVAAPGTAGELDYALYTRGTSNSTALASRWAHTVLEILERLRQQPGEALPPDYDVVLLKTLLVHGTDWADARAAYESALRNSQNGRTFTDYVGRLLGYGLADVARAITCTDQRVTVLGTGSVAADEALDFSLPLPPHLSALAAKRRITITLGWLTPVCLRRNAYRIAHLWFDPGNGLAPNRVCADFRAVQRGTVQHEVLEGENAVDFQDGESITIRVNCRSDAEDLLEPIRFGLAVTIEVAPELQLPLYQEVQDRLRIRVPVERRAVH